MEMESNALIFHGYIGFAGKVMVDSKTWLGLALCRNEGGNGAYALT